MARRNKDDNVCNSHFDHYRSDGLGIYVAVKALINLNERFIESVSNPAGVIGLFFGLLIAVALIIRVFIYRGFRKKPLTWQKRSKPLTKPSVAKWLASCIRKSNSLPFSGQNFTMPEIKPPVHCSVLWILRINSKSKHYFPAPR